MQRTVTFTVSADGAITPALPQYAGVQGEHNTAVVVFDVSAWQAEAFVYRAEFVDGCGSGDMTGMLIPDASRCIAVPLPRAWTNAGGQAVLRLVASVMTDGEEVQTVFVVDAPLQFADKQNATGLMGDVDETGLSQLIVETREAQEAAKSAADEILRMAEDGDFDGEKGEKGDKGDTGAAGADGYGLLPVVDVYTTMQGMHYVYEVFIGEEYEELPPRWMLSVYLTYGTSEGSRLWIYGKYRLLDVSIGWCKAEKGEAFFAYDGTTLHHIVGAKGEKGDTGEKGEKGDKGDTGPQGEKGDTGEQGPQGEKGEFGTSVEQTVLYENADGLSTTYTAITVANPAEYDYFVVVTNRGTFPIYYSEKLSRYITGGTFVSLGGGGFYAASVCFGANGATWTSYELACFYVATTSSPVWPTSPTSLKLYKIIGVKTAAALPTWEGGAY